MLAPAALGSAPPAPDTCAEIRTRSPDGVPQHLILALDGIPFDLFEEAHRSGLFPSFRSAGRLVAPFPSLTDVSFAAMAGTDPPEGYQVMRFDAERNRTVGRTVGSLSGENHRHLPTDSRTWSALHRMRSYALPYRTALSELRSIRQQLLASDLETFVAYVEATDPILHVHGREKAEQFLVRLDAFLDGLETDVLERTGRSLAVTLVSDHGSTLVRGELVPVKKSLAEAGFCRSKRLRGPSDVAYSQAGIIGFLALHCWPGREEALARALAPVEGVELVAWREDGVVRVSSRDGEALISSDGDGAPLRLCVLSGDPLWLGDALGEAANERPTSVLVDAEASLHATCDGSWPDPVVRLWRAFHAAVREPADVVVSMADGYESGNRFVRALAALRGRRGTHGSLTRSASLGFIASNWRDLPDVDAWQARSHLFGDEAEAELRAHCRGALQSEADRNAVGH